MWRQLKARGVRVGKRRFRVCTTDSNHALPIAPNLLARNFTVARANTVWAGDMTYIPTGEGWLNLAVVLDLFSRRIATSTRRLPTRTPPAFSCRHTRGHP